MAARLLVDRIHSGLSLELNIIFCIFLPAGVLLYCFSQTIDSLLGALASIRLVTTWSVLYGLVIRPIRLLLVPFFKGRDWWFSAGLPDTDD
jgi:hypothetical protein